MEPSTHQEARRGRRIERRRSEILEAAAQVFADKGYESATTRDIAAAVDMGESTLYNYFQNKRQVLLAIIEQKQLEMDDFLRHIDQVEDRQGLVELIDKGLQIWLSRVNYTRTMIGEAWRDPEVLALAQVRLTAIFNLLTGYLERHVAAGRFQSRPVPGRRVCQAGPEPAGGIG